MWLLRCQGFSRWPTEEKVGDWHITAACLDFPTLKTKVCQAALCKDRTALIATCAVRLTYKTCQMRNWRAEGPLGSDSEASIAQQWEECCNNRTSLLIFLPERINHPIVKKTTLHFRGENHRLVVYHSFVLPVLALFQLAWILKGLFLLLFGLVGFGLF